MSFQFLLSRNYNPLQVTQAYSWFRSVITKKSLLSFRQYLLGTPFTLITDCNSLKLALQKKDFSPRIARWIVGLQEFDFSVIHKPGSQMTVVDATSRSPVPSGVNVNLISDEDWIFSMQNRNKFIAKTSAIILTEKQKASCEVMVKKEEENWDHFNEPSYFDFLKTKKNHNALN
ncbi:hypothetical protein TcasGA2_TC031016 [Tribolium castaneum]|uniref:Reverse transcriptase RNase H-like domain-containing protein n=1 Tax=Tribolium castaneum TaxID=7070 RepID=A0A139W9I0_TRICA|nr:hypothetical protein TcasGA2_TC031016 [Tribolium castaneum]